MSVGENDDVHVCFSQKSSSPLLDRTLDLRSYVVLYHCQFTHGRPSGQQIVQLKTEREQSGLPELNLAHLSSDLKLSANPLRDNIRNLGPHSTLSHCQFTH